MRFCALAFIGLLSLAGSVVTANNAVADTASSCDSEDLTEAALAMLNGCPPPDLTDAALDMLSKGTQVTQNNRTSPTTPVIQPPVPPAGTIVKK